MKTKQKLSWLFFDFDGVLTDNRVWVLEDGREAVVCSRADGLGFSMLRKAGIKCMIVSTETNPVVGRRARKLKLKVLQGIEDKGVALQALFRRDKIDPRTVGFVGNDLNDMPAFKVVGHRFCPSDAAPEIKAASHHVLRSRGGMGVAREIATRIKEFSA